MARIGPRPTPTQSQTLQPVTTHCPHCGQMMWADYTNHRNLITLDGTIRLHLLIRRCHLDTCPRYRIPFRPEAEGRIALPYHEFGLDVISLVGQLRYLQHRSIAEIHQLLTQRSVLISHRTVRNLLDRYDELCTLTVNDPQRVGSILAPQGRVILALDGLQPDVGHEVLWVLRDCISGTILMARSLLSSTQDDLAALILEVKDAIPVPITAVVSDGQTSIQRAVAKALPGVPHQLCQFHYLREATRPIYEADRHAKKELKKRVRGIRVIERQAEHLDGPERTLIEGYCAAVRSALTDDGAAPLKSPGLLLHERLTLIAASLDRLVAKGKWVDSLKRLRRLLEKGLRETADSWPVIREWYGWVRRVAHILSNEDQACGKVVRRRLNAVLREMRRRTKSSNGGAGALLHFLKVTESYKPGLFHCYDGLGLPRTNNDLEQLFGSHRYHERRANGRKKGGSGVVVRGSVRLVSSVSTRLRSLEGVSLVLVDLEKWKELRSRLSQRVNSRCQQRRFRQNPQTYLSKLENIELQSTLPH